MSKALTEKQWNAQTPPIYWLKIRGLNGKTPVELSLIDKWLSANTASWWYRSYEHICFGSAQDRVSFKTFFLLGLLEKEFGEIE